MNKQITLVAITAAILTAGAILSVSMIAHTAFALITPPPLPPSTFNANGGSSIAGGGVSGNAGNGGHNFDCDTSNCNANGGTSQANGGISSLGGAGGTNTDCDTNTCNANGGDSFAGGGLAGNGGTGGTNAG